MSKLSDLLGAGAALPQGFMGLPSASLDDLQADIAVVGVPMATPYQALGGYCAEGPAAIRAGAADSAHGLGHVDFDFSEPLLDGTGVVAVDLGDLATATDDFAANRALIENTIRAIRAGGTIPVVIGGDDSVPIPVFAALADTGPITIVQVDAHIDWRDEIDGERMGLSSNMRRASEMGAFSPMVQIGARSIGSARPQDLKAARDFGAHIIDARRFHAEGLDAVLPLIPESQPVFINFDVDGLDPTTMPAVIGPAPGGLSYTQALELLHGVAGRAAIIGANFLEFMPARDINGLGALTAARLVSNTIGLIARQRFAARR